MKGTKNTGGFRQLPVELCGSLGASPHLCWDSATPTWHDSTKNIICSFAQLQNHLTNQRPSMPACSELENKQMLWNKNVVKVSITSPVFLWSGEHCSSPSGSFAQSRKGSIQERRGFLVSKCFHSQVVYCTSFSTGWRAFFFQNKTVLVVVFLVFQEQWNSFHKLNLLTPNLGRRRVFCHF